MLEGAAQKWLPLVLLAGIGMFFSEFLIWNVAGFSATLAEGAGRAAAALIITYAIYFAVFTLFADLVQRFRVNDLYGMLLLGSAYGLVMEGIFADVMYIPYGIGPAIFGIPLIHYNFTALSWHPLIDFTAGFVLFGMLLRGRAGFESGKISLRWIAAVAAFCAFWFVWAHAQWLEAKIPGGIPLEIRLAVVLLPIVAFWVLLGAVFASKAEYVPKEILTAKTYLLFAGFLALAAAGRFLSVENKAGFAFVVFLIGLYLLFFFAHARLGNGTAQRSTYEEAFPIRGGISVPKYAITALLVLLFYALFEFATSAFSLAALWRVLTIFGFLAFNLFAVVFFFFALGKTTWEFFHLEKGFSLKIKK